MNNSDGTLGLVDMLSPWATRAHDRDGKVVWVDDEGAVGVQLFRKRLDPSKPTLARIPCALGIGRDKNIGAEKVTHILRE